MLYELRIYHTVPGKLPALNQRFASHTLKLWERFGIRQVGFWTQQIGDNNSDLYYILEWESLAEREQKWNPFVTDPEWLKIKGETEKDGPLITHVTNMMLAPTAYSKMK
jgi:NIPSNAP